eukprot:Clim_evm60s147 gene=Clim_evmTU60s147
MVTNTSLKFPRPDRLGRFQGRDPYEFDDGDMELASPRVRVPKVVRTPSAGPPARPLKRVCSNDKVMATPRPGHRASMETLDDDSERIVGLVLSDPAVRAFERSPKYGRRTKLVFSLLEATGFVDKCISIPCMPADRKDLQQFHGSEYIDLLLSEGKSAGSETMGTDATDRRLAEHGLLDDCPLFTGVADFASYAAGSSLSAARALLHGQVDVAINWFGGWHHAFRNNASGFCFVNDIVLAILELRKRFRRVLYVDLDLHHGDAIEKAFAHSNSVYTMSMHYQASGFFPGTGQLEYTGEGKGEGYNLNVPMPEYCSDTDFYCAASLALNALRTSFTPDCVVVQCGADGLAMDPHKIFNLTEEAHVSVLNLLKSWNIPMLVLGGGGYNETATAKLWCHLTAQCLGEKPPDEVPDYDGLLEFHPDYTMRLRPCLGQQQCTQTMDSLRHQLVLRIKRMLDMPSDHIVDDIMQEEIEPSPLIIAMRHHMILS